MIFNKNKNKKNIKKFAERIIDKQILKKVYKTKEKNEREETLKHLINTALEQGYNDLIKRVKNIENQKKDVFFASIKLGLLKSKIKVFEASLDKEDFNNVIFLFKDIEKEIKNIK